MLLAEHDRREEAMKDLETQLLGVHEDCQRGAGEVALGAVRGGWWGVGSCDSSCGPREPVQGTAVLCEEELEVVRVYPKPWEPGPAECDSR